MKHTTPKHYELSVRDCEGTPRSIEADAIISAIMRNHHVLFSSEGIDIPAMYYGYLFNVIKYPLRSGSKGDVLDLIQDLKKTSAYIDKAIACLEEVQ